MKELSEELIVLHSCAVELASHLSATTQYDMMYGRKAEVADVKMKKSKVLQQVTEIVAELSDNLTRREFLHSPAALKEALRCTAILSMVTTNFFSYTTLASLHSVLHLLKKEATPTSRTSQTAGSEDDDDSESSATSCIEDFDPHDPHLVQPDCFEDAAAKKEAAVIANYD